MKKLIFILIASTTLLLACSTEEDKPEGNQEIVDQDTYSTNSNEIKSGSDTKPNREVSLHEGDVTLVDGKKWQSNAQVNELVNEIKSKIEGYKSSANFDRNEAVKELKQYVQKLISNAKLPGESQNQFFNWTTKYMRNIVKLSEANSQPQINEALDLLSQDTKDYFQNFE